LGTPGTKRFLGAIPLKKPKRTSSSLPAVTSATVERTSGVLRKELL